MLLGSFDVTTSAICITAFLDLAASAAAEAALFSAMTALLRFDGWRHKRQRKKKVNLTFTVNSDFGYFLLTLTGPDF